MCDVYIEYVICMVGACVYVEYGVCMFVEWSGVCVCVCRVCVCVCGIWCVCVCSIWCVCVFRRSRGNRHEGCISHTVLLIEKVF